MGSSKSQLQTVVWDKKDKEAAGVVEKMDKDMSERDEIEKVGPYWKMSDIQTCHF